MTTIADRLKALGVSIGVGEIAAPKRERYPIEQVVEGRTQSTPFGESFAVETAYPHGHTHGAVRVALTAPRETLAAWSGDARIAAGEAGGFTFLDTETTGLGGSGTYAFLVGVGRFDEEGFRLTQFFMRDPAEEPAMLAALDGYLALCETVVTFNGKSFDLPLLNARYITNSAPAPLKNAAHLDLLPLARRMWRERLPSRALGYLEEHVLGQTRTEADVPGWMIPQMYVDYVHTGDARPLKGIFYHNAMDVLAMAALMEHIAGMLANPLDGRVEHAEDLLAMARLYEDLGHLDLAAQLFERGLEGALAAQARSATMQRLSYLHRRRGELTNALSLWWQAAADREIYAHEELAKYYEHQARDFAEALKWTQAALALLKQADTPRYERVHWEPLFKHRQQRLKRRLAGKQVDEEAE